MIIFIMIMVSNQPIFNFRQHRSMFCHFKLRAKIGKRRKTENTSVYFSFIQKIKADLDLES